MLAPTAGASLDVRASQILGFRRLKGFASSDRRLVRRRVKKRKRRRWKSRIDESEIDKRKFGDRQKPGFRGGLS